MFYRTVIITSIYEITLLCTIQEALLLAQSNGCIRDKITVKLFSSFRIL